MAPNTKRWHEHWLRFQSLSPQQQVQELAQELKREGAYVHSQWADMTKRQRDEAIISHLSR